jgi:hypothetical protein
MILQMHALKSKLKPAKALKARALRGFNCRRGFEKSGGVHVAKTLRVNHTRYVHAYESLLDN